MTDNLESPEGEQYTELFAAREQAIVSDQGSSEVQRELEKDLECARLLRSVLRFSKAPARTAPSAQEDPSPSVLPWKKLGRFELRRELGRGGFGIVYLAHDPVLGRAVALKVPRPEVVVTAELRARFQREARAASNLDHPNLVAVHEAGEVGPVCYLVTAYCPGPTLAQWLAQHREPIPARDAAALIAPLADAVAHAHERGVIHRDLKPANILLQEEETTTTHTKEDPEETENTDSNSVFRDFRVFRGKTLLPRITDFGLARNLLDGIEGYTQTGAILGTPSYMAPEQASGSSRAVGPPADVHALGAILYELLAGRPPFRGDSPVDTLVLVREVDPVPPRQFNPKVPRDLEVICLKCLEKAPTHRYGTARELADDLRRFLGGQPIQARPAGVGERLVRWCRRNPLTATAAGVAACALLAVVVLAVSFALHQSHAADRLREEQKATATALEKSREQYTLAERRSAQLALDRGLTLCEQDRIGHGMLWLAQSLAIASRLPSRESGDLQRLIRAHLGACHPRYYPLRFLLAHPGTGESGLALSPDGQTILTSDQDQRIRLWDAGTGKRRQMPYRVDVGSTLVAVSPDGKWMLTNGLDRATVQLRDAATGRGVGPLLIHHEAVRTAAFSPDSRTVLTGSWDHTARLWEVSTGKPISPPLQHEERVLAVTFHPDGRTLLTGSQDGTARLWKVSTGKPILSPLLHQASVCAVAFSPDGKLIATGGEDRAVFFWDGFTGAPLGTPLRHTHAIRSLAFSPDGSILLTGGDDRMARLWSVATRKPLGVPLAHPAAVLATAYSPDGRHILTGGWDGPVRLWEVIPNPPPVPPLQHPDRVRAVAFRSDGRVLLTGCQDGMARFWDTSTGKQIGPTLRHNGRVLNVAFSPDNRIVLTGSHDRTVRLWDALSGQLVVPPLAHDNQINGLAWCPDGRSFVTACEDRAVRLWDARSGKLLLPPLQHDKALQGVVVSPDGRTVVTAEGTTAHFWETATGRRLEPPIQVMGSIRTVAFSADGRWLLTGSTTNAQVWDVKTRRARGPTLPHQATVSAVAFSRDGQTLATGSFDRTAQLWDAVTCQPIGPALVHAGEIGDVAFHPDGHTLVTASYDGTVRLWPVCSAVKGEPERIRDWVEAITGLTLNGEGVFQFLSADAWEQRRQRLHELGGPPLP